MARLLIIEDEKLARVTLCKILERAGHEVVAATNGVEGLAMFRSRSFDLVITDMLMPEKEGVETVIELVREFKGVNIIAISGGGRTRNLDFLKLAKEHGAKMILAKPFTNAELLDAVDTVLRDAAGK